MISITTRCGSTITVQVASDEGSITEDLNIVGTGTARCKPGDLFAVATGERIALGRAISDFGRQVEAAGLAESVCVEDVDRVLNALVLAALS